MPPSCNSRAGIRYIFLTYKTSNIQSDAEYCCYCCCCCGGFLNPMINFDHCNNHAHRVLQFFACSPSLVASCGVVLLL